MDRCRTERKKERWRNVRQTDGHMDRCRTGRKKERWKNVRQTERKTDIKMLDIQMDSCRKDRQMVVKTLGRLVERQTVIDEWTDVGHASM